MILSYLLGYLRKISYRRCHVSLGIRMMIAYFDHDNSFLNDVVHFRLDQIDQCTDAPFGRLFHFDGASTDGPN